MDLTIFLLALCLLAAIVVFLLWKCYTWGYSDGYAAGYDYGAREVENFYQRKPRRFSKEIMDSMKGSAYS